MRLSKDLFDDSTILCGERQAKLIDGFDIDNSPGNYRPETVNEKSLLFTSSNGSGTILKSKYAREVVIAGFINISAVVGVLAASDSVVVICAGEARHLALEDALCAGMIVSNLSKPGDILSDGAMWSKMIYERCSDSLMSAIRNSSHGKELEADGFGADVTFCATCDVYTDVPRFDGNVIRGTRGPKAPVRL
jgi:2-phosphosulfolactate phosphatase